MSTYWINCDIDGAGRRWRIAVERDGPEVYFPIEDFGEEMSIAEYREEFPGTDVETVAGPGDLSVAADQLDALRYQIRSLQRELREGKADLVRLQASVMEHFRRCAPPHHPPIDLPALRAEDRAVDLPTGYWVRAQMPDGLYATVCISLLTPESLRAWLWQRGAVPVFVESLVFGLLGTDWPDDSHRPSCDADGAR